jgi:hypothetical protein
MQKREPTASPDLPFNRGLHLPQSILKGPIMAQEDNSAIARGVLEAWNSGGQAHC